jgi:hypothetical protein
MILINWLLAAAWVVDRQYALWAILVVFLWWVAGLKRNPRWPSPSRRGLIYLGLIFWFLAVGFVTGVTAIYLIPVEILVLWLIQSRFERPAAPA